MMTCRICRAPRLQRFLVLGEHPVSSHFRTTGDEQETQHEISLGSCDNCGVIQLMHPIPHIDLVPPFDWITYREPEDHLDAVVSKICQIMDIDEKTKVTGLTFKDQTTLDRLERVGCKPGHVIDAVNDLGAIDPNSNIETVQALLTPELARKIVDREGSSNLLIVRHIVEHSENVQNFMQALYELLAPGGYLVIEVPDCAANLERQDYTMIWEEHVSYFTRETLPQILEPSGFDYLDLEVHSYPFEDVLLLYARKPEGQAKAISPVTSEEVSENQKRARTYGAAFSHWTEQYHRLFKDWTKDGRKLAAYGAGHLTCAFINFHDVAKYFAFVVDDTPQKQGLYLPGTELEIVPRSLLKADEISLCLFGLAPEIEDKVIGNNSAYHDADGKFASIFVDSSRSIRNLIEP